MVKRFNLYPCLALVIALICAIFLSSCGGGGNSSAVPNTNPAVENPVNYINPTPTPVLTNKPVSGYIYANNIITDEGETVPCINILDVPACQADSSGNEPFVTQVLNSLQQDYPEEWAKPSIQDLYTQLNKTLSESKPLLEYNAQAKVSSAYNDTSIPVGSDGHFDNTVLTGVSDSNVKLEVALGEDNYTEVETLSSSDNIISSDAVNTELKSCPEKIFSFPGEVIIFKVYSEPGINLKSAGLKFTLNNPSIVCITQPVYLCLFGAHKYQVAYGCVYIKPGLDTPVDTTITARLNSGQSMSIFLEVIKKTASVSGIVYTGGSTLVKGYVKSLGPKACCKIDSSGQYSLPKVFMGHSRSVIATWWTSENGRKVRHREEKIIDFFSQDVTGFNFGVPPTPTPTLTPTATPTLRPPEDKFYSIQISKVIAQYMRWEEELGNDQAIEKTVKWLNGETNQPVPDGIKRSRIVDRGGVAIGVEFVDGMFQTIDTTDPFEDAYDNNINKKEHNSVDNLKLLSINNTKSITGSEITTFKPDKILILSPFDCFFKLESDLDFKDIGDELVNKGYDVTIKLARNTDFNPVLDSSYDPESYNYDAVLPSNADSNTINNIIRPGDYEQLGDYGLIYISTHSWNEGIIMGVYTYQDPPTRKWIQNNWGDFMDGTCEFHYQKCDHFGDTYPGLGNPITKWGYIQTIAVNKRFFENLNTNPSKDFKGSIVFIAGCESGGYTDDNGVITHKLADAFSSADIYLGCYGHVSYVSWHQGIGYYFLRYMMEGPIAPVGIPGYDSDKILSGTPAPEPNCPMHAKEAWDALNYYNVIRDPRHRDRYLKMFPPEPDNQIYFPAPVNIIVDKKY
ncbi:MAG: hypothetical protein ABRQ38_10040 [Candidatus Eremiobacterota bacterium]